jgi:molybdopterin synthase sulfur carrier subunit
MARVFIPADLRPLTGGLSLVEVEGATIREVIAALDAKHPGLAVHLTDGDRLQPGLAVAVDSRVSAKGLRESVSPDSEVQFLPAISGG